MWRKCEWKCEHAGGIGACYNMVIGGAHNNSPCCASSVPSVCVCSGPGLYPSYDPSLSPTDIKAPFCGPAYINPLHVMSTACTIQMAGRTAWDSNCGLSAAGNVSQIQTDLFLYVTADPVFCDPSSSSTSSTASSLSPPTSPGAGAGSGSTTGSAVPVQTNFVPCLLSVRTYRPVLATLNLCPALLDRLAAAMPPTPGNTSNTKNHTGNHTSNATASGSTSSTTATTATTTTTTSGDSVGSAATNTTSPPLQALPLSPARDSLLATVTHELLHIIGFNDMLFPFYIDSLGARRGLEKVVQTVGPPAGGNSSLRSNYSRIITPGVVREVRRRTGQG